MGFPHEHGNESESYWIATTPTTSFAPLGEDLRADVAVVGGGIAGLTAAHLLAKAGKSVIVLDRERVAMAETGHTTAHLQNAIDTRLATLKNRIGLDGARRVWDSQAEAIRLIEDVSREERIPCDLERLDAYLYTPRADERALLAEELRLTREIGYPAEEASPHDVPYHAEAAIRLPDQGKFHPRKYLLGLTRKLDARGARVFEGTEVTRIEDGHPATVRTRDGHAVTADWVLETTNVPNGAKMDIHMRMLPSRSYVIGARVPRGTFRNALYWDTLVPYHYTRVETGPERDLVILGGEDHKVGAEGAAVARYDALEGYLREATEDYEVVHRWSGEVLETEDDLAYIGALPEYGSNRLTATGFSGTGMTNGTLAAIMLTERVLGRGTPWDALYDPQRAYRREKPEGQPRKRSEDDPRDRIHGGEGPMFKGAGEASALALGEGVVLKSGKHPIAVSRTEDGRLRAFSARCPHAGCTVAWNRVEGSWDCPCHGSRFAPTGEVLHGPAVEPLKETNASELEGQLRGVEPRRAD